MTMRSPVAALLWENWRLTRIEAVQRVALGVIAPAFVLTLAAAVGPVDAGAARLSLGLLVMMHMPLWLSVAKLNGGRFMDGYRPGYPFYVLYTRPIRTFVMVGAPMVYLAASGAAAYILSALLLRGIFGYPFPLMPLAGVIAAYHVAQWAAQWATSNKVLQFGGTIVVSLLLAVPGYWRGRQWPATHFDPTAGDYALMAAIVVASFALTVAGVARQRRGDAVAASPRTLAPAVFADWLAGRLRFRCPTRSASLAQVWFALTSSGLPVLAIGLALAIVIPLLFEVTTRLDVALSGFYERPATRGVAVVVAAFSLPALLIFGGNAFGVRVRQGRPYASVFDATHACSTARMAGVRVLVRSACLLAALFMVGMSVWISASEIPFDVLDDNDTLIEKTSLPLSGWMRSMEGAVGAMSAYGQVAVAFVTAVAVAIMVAMRAALQALRARYPSRVTIAGSLLLILGLVLVLRAPDGEGGDGLDVLFMDAFFRAAPWITATAMALATVYLFWSVLAERLLTPRQALVATLISAAFGAAWVTMLRAAGVELAWTRTTDVFWTVSPMVLLLMSSLLAPWSLSRIRHA